MTGPVDTLDAGIPWSQLADLPEAKEIEVGAGGDTHPPDMSPDEYKKKLLASCVSLGIKADWMYSIAELETKLKRHNDQVDRSNEQAETEKEAGPSARNLRRMRLRGDKEPTANEEVEDAQLNL